MNAWPIDPPPNDESTCERCGDASPEAVCRACSASLDEAAAREQERNNWRNRRWRAAYAFAASAEGLRLSLDRGVDLYDLDLEVGEALGQAAALLVLVGVEPIDEDDLAEVAAIVASQELGEKIEVWS